MDKKKKPIYKKWWFYLIIVLIIGGVASQSNKDTPTSGGTTDSNKETKEEAKTTFALGEVIEYKDFTITISNKREIVGLANDTYIVFDVEVVSKKDGLSFSGTFQGVTSDNQVVDDTLALTSDDLGDPIMTAFTTKINNGQKIKGYLAFKQPIAKIEMQSSYFSNKTITILVD